MNVRCTLWPAAVLCLLVAATSAASLLAQNQETQEWNKLQGAWSVTAGEQNGRPNDGIKGGVLTITDRAFHLKTSTGNDFRGQLRIDVTASPLQLDFVHENGTVWQAIYTVNADVLRLNYVQSGEQTARPRLFATSADTPGSIVVLRKRSAVPSQAN